MLFVPVRDAASGQVIGRHFDAHAITHEDTNAILAHLTRDRRQNDMVTIIELNFEECVRLLVNNNSRSRNQIIFSQKESSPDFSKRKGNGETGKGEE